MTHKKNVKKPIPYSNFRTQCFFLNIIIYLFLNTHFTLYVCLVHRKVKTSKLNNKAVNYATYSLIFLQYLKNNHYGYLLYTYSILIDRIQRKMIKYYLLLQVIRVLIFEWNSKSTNERKNDNIADSISSG